MSIEKNESLNFTCLEEINILLNSKREAIHVQTFEESRFETELRELLIEKEYKAISWSITGGGTDLISGEPSEEFSVHDPINLMKRIKSHDEQTVFILKDFHDIWGNYQAKRALRDVLEGESMVYKPIVFISPEIGLPIELEKLVTTLQYELPNREDVIEQLEGMEDFLRSINLPTPEGREREAIIHALVGMTKTEINNVLKQSVVKYRKIIPDEITEEKKQVIRKTGLLEYITKLDDMSDVGGMDIFKDWLDDAYYAFGPEAEAHNIDTAKGAIISGFPGTGIALVSSL